MRKLLLVLLLALLSMLAGMLAFVYLFDWNRARAPISERVSAALERRFEIRGDLDLAPRLLVLEPRLRVEGVRLANPGWAGDAPMVAVERLEVSLSLLDLLRGDIVLPVLHVQAPRVELRRLRDGTVNWQFGDDDAERDGERLELPLVRDLRVTDGLLLVSDEVRPLQASGSFGAAQDLAAEPGRRTRLQLDGTANGGPLELRAWGEELRGLAAGEPYRLGAELRAGATHLALDGHLEQPLGLDGLRAELQLEGPNLGELYRLLGVALPDTPPYRLEGRLYRVGTEVGFEAFSGTVGDSDLGGDLLVELAGERPLLEARVRSQLLDFDDLAPLVGAPPDTDEAASADQEAQAQRLAAEQRLLPASALDLSRMRAMDARVHYTAEAVKAPRLPLRGVELELSLDDGLLELEPLNFELPQGDFESTISIDARQSPAVSRLDVRLINLDTAQLMEAAGAGGALSGALSARLELETRGNSPRAAAAASSGRLVVGMDEGEVRHLFVELVGLDIGDALGIVVDGEDRLPLRCAVAAADIDDGVAEIETFVIDTTDSVVVAEGSVDLGEEMLDLVIKARPKDPSLLSARTPITVGGRLRAPQIGLEADQLAIKALAATALGTLLTPAAAALAFIEPGLEENSNCRRLAQGSGAEDLEGIDETQGGAADDASGPADDAAAGTDRASEDGAGEDHRTGERQLSPASSPAGHPARAGPRR